MSEQPRDGVAGLQAGDQAAPCARLKRRADFLAVAKGRRAHGRAFSLQALKRGQGEDGEVRFGITVTRKVGGAVERNRIKRRLRALLRRPEALPQVGHDYVLVARRDALTMPFAALIEDLSAVLRRSAEGGRAFGRPAGSRERRRK